MQRNLEALLQNSFQRLPFKCTPAPVAIELSGSPVSVMDTNGPHYPTLSCIGVYVYMCVYVYVYAYIYSDLLIDELGCNWTAPDMM